MDTTIQPLSPTEKHNAMISYCFLAPFMLLSREERFRSDFVRSHARYATLIHIGFLILIVSFVRSRNFSSTILYDLTWVNGVLFVLFFMLLFLLGKGIYSALRGEKPRIALNSFSIKSLEKEFSTEITVSIEEKTPLILSHIPFFGMYLSAKYGGKMAEGEKFGNWLCIALTLSIIVDPSMTLFVIMILLVTFWLVYQGIATEKDTTVHLLGDKFWTGAQIHLYTQSTIRYISALFKHDKTMPSFTKISEEIKANPLNTVQENGSPVFYLPVLNIPHLIRFREEEDTRITRAQGTILSIMVLYGLIVGDYPIVFLGIFAGFWAYNQSHFHKNSYIPIIGECAQAFFAFLKWRKEKSATKEIHLSTTNK